MSFRVIVAQLASMPPIRLDGHEIGGVELASIVAVNQNLPEHEAMDTPQIISELGRLTARALRQKERAELEYRVWRDGQVYALTNSVAEATKEKFKCAVDPDYTGTGKNRLQKEPTTPSVAQVELWLKTQPEYVEHWDAQQAATEAWGALHASYEAAKARTWAIKLVHRDGGPDVPVSRAYDEGDNHEKDTTYSVPCEVSTHPVIQAGSNADVPRRGPPPPPPLPPLP